MSIQMSRRSAVALGLGLLAAAPASALAQTITKTGTSGAGEALEGLVTVHGRSYLYVGGELYKGGRREYRGKERYFHPEDGHMAVDEDVTWDDGTQHHYDAEGVLHDGPDVEDGWYTITCEGGKMALDATAGKGTVGTALDVYEKNGTSAQAWYVKNSKDGKSVVITGASGRAVDVKDGSSAEGAATQLYTANGTDSQAWELERADGGYKLLSLRTSRYLGYGKAKNGAGAVSTADGAVWSFEPCEQPRPGDGWHELVCSNGLVADIESMRIKNGANAQAWTANGSSAQRFKTSGFKGNGGSILTFVEKSLDVKDGSAANNANVQQWERNGSDAQVWELVADGDGWNIRNSASGLMLASQGAEAGANLVSAKADGTPGQRWHFAACDAPSDVNDSMRLARDWGGWDFTDWNYVETMRQRAIQYNNGESWYITNDCDFPCRDTVFALIDGVWCPVAGFYAADGSLSDQGHSRSWKAHCNIAHRNAQLAQRHWVTCYFVCNPVGDHDCQAYHDGWQPGETGYQYGGCSGLTTEHAKWIYDNVPDGAHVDICGNATVPGDPCTGDHTRLENLGINNPFA